MKEIFILRINDRNFSEKLKHDLDVPRRNQTSFGTKSHKYYGPNIWSALSYEIKSAESINITNN